MKITKSLIVLAFTGLLAACGSNPENAGHSTPIDSTNVKGSAPATYGPEDPAYKADSNHTNVNDTGTNAGNVHNNGNPNSKK